MESISKLNKMHHNSKEVATHGLNQSLIEDFCAKDQRLVEAIDQAYNIFQELKQDSNIGNSFFKKPEKEQIAELQENFVNFYTAPTINPYVAIAAKGPWIITSTGAVLHDSGGYGMLGFGHAPDQILDVLAKPYVMANIMTASFWQKKIANKLNEHIGFSRKANSPVFDKYLCLNSGSESVTMGIRIADINARKQAKGRQIKFLALAGGFHGRTDRPAQASDSCINTYREHLASFKERNNLVIVEPNNIASLQKAFDAAERDGTFFELMLMEPVMGEGDPGKAISVEFYNLARKLTKEHGTFLLVDSIQAGLRATGCLSITDYPGFQDCNPPDFETFSKALNAGQFPLSVLALSKKASETYHTGLYGNTMTGNPRALAVACAVLDSVDHKIRENIKEKGKEFLTKFENLKLKYPNVIEKVQGTGLIFSVAINQNQFKVVGDDGLEMSLRKQGIGVIHGGKNSLRFTPVFDISSEEIDLIIKQVEIAITEKRVDVGKAS